MLRGGATCCGRSATSANWTRRFSISSFVTCGVALPWHRRGERNSTTRRACNSRSWLYGWCLARHRTSRKRSGSAFLVVALDQMWPTSFALGGFQPPLN